MKFINKKIRTARRAKKMSAEDLAFELRLIGRKISPQTIRRLENDPKNLGKCPAYLAEMCGVLDVTPEYFFN